MNPRSLRSRLVLWHALWLALVFLVTGTLIYFAVGRYLEHNRAQSERARAQRVAALVSRMQGAPPGRCAAEITADFAPEASERFIRVFRFNGAVLYQSGLPRDDSFDPAQIGPPPHTPGIRRAKLSGGAELILVTVPVGGPATVPATPTLSATGSATEAPSSLALAKEDSPLLVEVGESLAPAFTELHRLLLALALGFAMVTTVALAGGYVLVGRALRPVLEITRRAEGITSRNLAERLPVPTTADEFAQLSGALNRMIARLDEAFQHNRRFLADASHELRTPLTILHSELEALVQRQGAPDQTDDSLRNLLEEVQRLAGIVENLFALSRLDAGLAAAVTTQFDFAKLAATTAEQMCLLAEDKGVSITCQTPSPVILEGDRGRFKQIIVNLLDNAIKYTPPGGSVTLTVREHQHHAICEVTDNGIGIPAAALPRVFERFYRVDPARNREHGGAGLGLAIVKAICTAHSGRVEVESTEGRGSCFRVTLPLPGQPKT
jgi:heavy metal sensor kinase